MINTPNEFEVKEAWQKFLKTPEAAELQHTDNNSRLLHREVLCGDRDYSCQALQIAARTLRDALDLKPTEQAVGANEAKTQVSEPEPYDETKESGYPTRGGLEDGWKYQQRVTAWREQRKQREFREKENRRLLAAPPAASTIARTKLELKQRELEKQQYALRKANQS